MPVKRLVGNPVSVDTGFGDSSTPFEIRNSTLYYLNCVDNDESIKADIDIICTDAHDEGYLLDRVDAFYAWRQFSNHLDAHWLSPTSLDECRIFLIEEDNAHLIAGTET